MPMHSLFIWKQKRAGTQVDNFQHTQLFIYITDVYDLIERLRENNQYVSNSSPCPSKGQLCLTCPTGLQFLILTLEVIVEGYIHTGFLHFLFQQ